MASAKVISFGKQYLMLSNMATSPVFAAVCGAEQWTLQVAIETNTTNIPDCNDPDLPAWLGTEEVSKQMSFNFDGVLDTDQMQVFRDWVLDGGHKNVRWMNTGTSGNGGGYFAGSALLSAYSEGGQRGQKWRLQATITIDGKPTFTAAV